MENGSSSDLPCFVNIHQFNRSFSLPNDHQDLNFLHPTSSNIRRFSLSLNQNNINQNNLYSTSVETISSRPPSYNTLVRTNQITDYNNTSVFINDDFSIIPPSYYETLLISPPAYDIQLPEGNQAFSNLNNTTLHQDEYFNSNRCIIYFLLFVTFVSIIIIITIVITKIHSIKH
ncbi:membrane protein UL56 [Canid alphaherpesvirus 1]|nr:membrane protein UL56 [Canid alphaherpesvirus 1]QQL08704.1 membrane protein UL56 [Canid alphaherpesvirus 1]QQL09080.1 membrane protein UL56 [Canid alphaherpesvirus 1]QQL09155.1 membrane protein UL56 [Canid alphaherpesvirus 1]QQL09230.1 membrane protein UL56 [Canid alphaherpesvirus 1]